MIRKPLFYIVIIFNFTLPIVAYAHGNTLHFDHPLVAESPSPDTKVRFDYIYQNKPAENTEPKSKETTLRLEGEYALNHRLSVEVNLPYTFRLPNREARAQNLDNATIGVKYVNDTFENNNLLLGGGLELGLPTGNGKDGIGSDHIIEISPFLDFGYQYEQSQIIGFAEFGFPINKNNENVANFEFGWNLAFIYRGFGNIKPLLELDGTIINSGEEDGTNIVNLTPGLKYRWPGNKLLEIGVGVSFPLTDDKDFYIKPLVSVFYHF